MDRDLRKYSRQTIIRLLIGGLLLVIVIGTGLIYLIYGGGAAISGLICFGLGLIPLSIILLFFLLLDWIVKRYREE